MTISRYVKDRSSFTLIELLVVVAIIAILSVFVILTINPAELLKQGRDSQRVSDIATINSALNLYQVDNVTGSLGTASTTYISIPDNTATSTQGTQCQGLSLPALPTGWTYHCAASSTYRNTDGTGWIPVNFTSISYGSPLGTLPTDPTNTTSSNNYYTYTPGGSWELTNLFESSKYAATMTNDGGTDPALYETGTNISLVRGIRGLVGYWKFDEGSGTSAVDSSGNGNTGTWNGTVGSQWATGKVGSYAGSFNGTDNYVNAGNTTILSSLSLSRLTISTWMKLTVLPGYGYYTVVSKGQGVGCTSETYTLIVGQPVTSPSHMNTFGSCVANSEMGASSQLFTSSDLNTWIMITMTYDGTQQALYKNGILLKTGTTTGPLNATSYETLVGADGGASLTQKFFQGALDDVRIYNRALSASEIQSLYNATR